MDQRARPDGRDVHQADADTERQTNRADRESVQAANEYGRTLECQGTMDEEYLFWDAAATYMAQLGLGI